MALVALTTVKKALQVRTTDQVDDNAINLAIDAASSMILDHTGRIFEKATALQARTYEVYRGSVDTDDIATRTGLAVTVDNVVSTTYTTHPHNAIVMGRPIQRLEDLPRHGKLAVVTATYGWPAVPRAVEQAALLQALRLFHRRSAPFGVAGSPEVGSEVRLLSRLDPDVEALLRPYVRSWAYA